MKTKQIVFAFFLIFATVLFLARRDGLIAPVNATGTIVNLSPAADSKVRVNSPNTNYGSDTLLSIQGDDFRVTYMKFDLTSLANKTIISAKLRFKTPSDGGSQSGQIVRLITDTSWTESGITYNNSYNSSNSGLKPGTQLATLNGGAGSSWLEIPLTTAVENGKGKMFSFAMVPRDIASTDEMKFNSKEASADKPVLVVEYAAAAATSTPTKTPTKTPTPLPPTVTPAPTFQGITSGQTISGNIFVRLLTSATNINKIDFLIDGQLINTEDTAPYCLKGDNGTQTCNAYDTRQLTNGTHTLAVIIYFNNGTTTTMQVSFIVNNTAASTPTPTKTLTPTPTQPGGPTATRTPTPTITKTPTPTQPGAPTATRTPTPSPTTTTTPATPTPTVTTAPPAVHITNPSDNEIIYDTTINVSYTQSGNLSGVDHVHLILDNNAEVRDLDNDGQYFFTNVPTGTHTLKVYLARADHSKFANPEATSEIKFVVSSAPTPTSEPTTTPVPICETRSRGDANCDSVVNFIDFEIWRKEFSGEQNTTDANFNYKDGDTKVDIIDFEIWRQGYLSETPTMTPGVTVVVDPLGYSLQKSQDVVNMRVSQPGEGYAVYAVLKLNAAVVTNQTDFTYAWIIDNPAVVSGSAFNVCILGIQTPCPYDHFGLTGKTEGSTKLKLKVKYNPTQVVVAETSFDINVVPSTATPTPTTTMCPMPTPCPTGYTMLHGDPPAGQCAQYACVQLPPPLTVTP